MRNSFSQARSLEVVVGVQTETYGKVTNEEGRPRPEHPVEPPRKADGEIDSDAWEQRLRDKGVCGLPDSELIKKIKEVRAGSPSSQAELRVAERYADAGYEVEIMRPTAETPTGEVAVSDEPLSPDFRVRLSGKSETVRVEVKFRESGERITKNNLNTHISHANRQISCSEEGYGDIVFDASQAASGGMDQTDIERYLKGKMTGNRFDPSARLTNVEYLEIIYSEGSQLKRSFVLRTVDGKVNGPFTEVFR
jgi:hypothetical protein